MALADDPLRTKRAASKAALWRNAMTWARQLVPRRSVLLACVQLELGDWGMTGTR